MDSLTDAAMSVGAGLLIFGPIILIWTLMMYWATYGK